MIQPPTVSAAYRPRPPRNTRALAATLAATLLISGLILWANSTNCVELVVASSTEKFKFLSSIAATYDPPRVERRCVTVTIIERASGTAESALKLDWANERGPRPDVWSPAATTWLLLLSEHRKELSLPELVPPVAQSLIQSPLVIAMPEPMATTLQGSGKKVGWHEVLTLARDPEGWALFGKTWGSFRLAKTTPLISTSGLHALINLNYAAQAETDPVAFLRGVESSVPHYADSVRSFLANLRRADDDDRALEYVSAIAVEEKQVYDYNRGNWTSDYCPTCKFTPPKEKLVALYPKEGTLVADHPYAVLNWTDDVHRQAAFDFQRHLESAPVQSLFQQEGFRDHRRQAGDVLQLPYFDPDEPRALYSPPTRAALVEMVDEWSATIRKRSNALIVLDVGPSLNSQVSELGTSKLLAVRRAISDALDLLADDDAIGLWTFPTADGRPFDEVLPITRRGPPPFALSSRLPVSTLTAGRTLYTAIRAAVDRVEVGFADQRVNAVIVISDGINGTADKLDDLLATLRPPDGRRVLIFTVALSSVVKDDLAKIAAESGGLFYDASDPMKISDSIRNALANL